MNPLSKTEGARWRVHRSRVVAAYLVGLREEGRGIRQMTDFLSTHGVPSTATVNRDEEPATVSWLAAGHYITCVVADEERAIYVQVVRPIVEGSLSDPL